MSRICVLAAAVCALLAVPASGQDRALGREFDNMALQIVGALNAEARRTPGKRLRVTFRPAWTSPLEGITHFCEPLASRLRNALHERVQSLGEQTSSLFEVAVAKERDLEPPDVTMSWAWDGADSVRVEAHVLFAGDRGNRYSASLPVSGLEERERACLFVFRRGGGEVTAKATGYLREEPSDDPTRIARRFEAGENLYVVGELSSAGENGDAWSVVLEAEAGKFRHLLTPDMESGAADRERDDRAFAAARQSDTASAYEAYLSDWSSGAHASEARRLRDVQYRGDRAAVESGLGLDRAARLAVQSGLKSLGLYEGPLDGDVGPSTREAISSWQSAKGYEAMSYLTGEQADAPIAAGRAAPARVSEVGDVFRDCPHCPEMVVVPSGSFTMGSPSSEKGPDSDEGPRHGVTIGSPFAVGVYEVMFAEWDACVSSGGCGGYRPNDEGWGRGRRPVVNVSWDDAQSCVAWLSRETGSRIAC